MSESVPARDLEAPLVLFLCRGNSATSIMAEALLRHLAKGQVRAASAGSVPIGLVSPYVLECLREHRIATAGLRSKSWDEFFGVDRPPAHMLINLGDRDACAANASWRHDPVPTVKAHWPTPDAEVVFGTATDKRLAFEEVFVLLEARIRRFLALPLDRLSDPALSQRLARIGEV